MGISLTPICPADRGKNWNFLCGEEASCCPSFIHFSPVYFLASLDWTLVVTRACTQYKPGATTSSNENQYEIAGSAMLWDAI
jgi:hypothetical protein